MAKESRSNSIENLTQQAREHDTYLTKEEQLLVQMREGHRNFMKLLLNSAESDLEKGRLEETQKKLDEAKSYALQLNGRDAGYFLSNAPQLYRKLEELTSARA